MQKKQNYAIQLVDEEQVIANTPALQCSICYLTLLNPVETECKHMFCTICYESAFVTRHKCPQCNTALDHPTLRPLKETNPSLYRVVFASLRVRCPVYSRRGCSWVGEYDNLTEHLLKTCCVQQRTCRDCNTTMGDLELLRDHLENHCLKRSVRCLLCSQYFEFEALAEHKANSCALVPVRCEIAVDHSSPWSKTLLLLDDDDNDKDGDGGDDRGKEEGKEYKRQNKNETRRPLDKSIRSRTKTGTQGQKRKITTTMRSSSSSETVVTTTVHSGCGKMIARANVQDHQRSKCTCTIISCTNLGKGCPIKMPRWMLHKHLEQCLYRTITCASCGLNDQITAAEMELHLSDQCPMTVVTCSNDTNTGTASGGSAAACGDQSTGEIWSTLGCGTTMQRRLLANHVYNVCPNTIVRCCYHPHGCVHSGQRGVIAEHEQENKRHMKLLSQALIRITRNAPSNKTKIVPEGIMFIDKRGVIQVIDETGLAKSAAETCVPSIFSKRGIGISGIRRISSNNSNNEDDGDGEAGEAGDNDTSSAHANHYYYGGTNCVFVTTTERHCFELNLKSCQWLERAQMVKARNSYSLVQYNFERKHPKRQRRQHEKQQNEEDGKKEQNVGSTFNDQFGSRLQIVVVGGSNDSKQEAPDKLPTTDFYDVLMNKWFQGPATLVAHRNPAAVVYQNRLYVFGGKGTQHCEYFDDGKWYRIADIPKMLYLHTALVANDKILVLGGYHEGLASNKVFEYFPDLNLWGSFSLELCTDYLIAGAKYVKDQIMLLQEDGKVWSLKDNRELSFASNVIYSSCSTLVS